jgi:hypothetical protein
MGATALAGVCDRAGVRSIGTAAERRVRWYLVVAIASSFGPYVVGGSLRTEHLVVYGAAALAVMMLLQRGAGARINVLAAALLFVWMWAMGWTSAVTLGQGGAPGFAWRTALGQLENISQPAAIVLTVSVLTWRVQDTGGRLLRTALLAWVLLLAANALVSVLQVFMPLDPYLERFWGQDPTGDTVARRALGLGRFGGVFNQPMEAGLSYAGGLLGWVYLWRGRERAPLLMATLPLLLLGGILSVSKVFLFVGLPLGALGFAREVSAGRFAIKRMWFGVAAIAGGVAAITWVSRSWGGAGYLWRFASLSRADPRSAIELLTAGRFGAGSDGMETRFLDVWHTAPITGRGLGTSQAFDSAYLEVFHQGGMVYVLLYVMLLLVLLLPLYFKSLRAAERALLGSLWVLVVVGGVGAPALTINRFSTCIWVVFSLLLLSGRRRMVGGRGPGVGVARLPGAQHY